MNAFFRTNAHTTTKQLRSIIYLLLLLGLAMPMAASAAGYLKIGDIKGESADKGHKDWIDLNSVTQAPKPDSISTPSTSSQESAQTASRPATDSSSTGAMRRTYEPVRFTKRIDKSSPLLSRAFEDGTVFPSAVVVVPDPANQGAYLKYEMKNVMISSYSTSSSSGQPTETISLNYEKIKVSHDMAKASIQNIRGD